MSSRVRGSVLAALLVLGAPARTAAGRASTLAPDSVLSPCLTGHATERWLERQIFGDAERADRLERESVLAAGATVKVIARQPALRSLATQSAVRVDDQFDYLVS